jgi:hypothetical protein
MAIKMAFANLLACAAGGAILGGGAVHVSEAPSRGEIHHIKPVKVKVAKVKPKVNHRVHYRKVHRPRHVVASANTMTCSPTQTVNVIPAPYVPPLPPQPMNSNSGGSVPVVIGGGALGGFGGGFFGGFFGGGGGASGGNVVISSTSTGSTSTSGGSTSSTGSSTSGGISSTTGGVSTSSGNVSTSSGNVSTSTGSSTSTSSSSSTSGGSTTSSSSTTTGGTEVPEPSMIALFGLAVVGLIFARNRKKIIA